MIGQTIDKYYIQRKLGEGGMGAVYQARDLTLQRIVALKVMRAEYAQQAELKERFLQEARAAARLDHPGIVRVHHFGETGDLLFIDMEYIRGENLSQLLYKLEQERRWIILPEALQLVHEVALALDYAHEMGVLHRDIKPANIMLRQRKRTAHEQALPYQPVVTDLGLAKLADSGLRTQEGLSVGGTPAYMSPEQVQGLPLDARSDVYSLGVLLYELTAGQRPFPIRNHPEAVRYHARMTPPPPRTLQPELPGAIEAIILQALEKQPERRYASAGALAQALDAIRLDSVPSTVPLRASSGAGDLHTLHQQGLQLSPSPPPVNSPTQDQLQVLRPDGSTYVATLGRRKLSVGRGPDNDVVINDLRVSRHHAQIDFDGTHYRVSDNGSDNGVYLGATRLPAHTPTIWTPDKTLRIGQHQLILQRNVVRVLPPVDNAGGRTPRPGPGSQEATLVNGPSVVNKRPVGTVLELERAATPSATDNTRSKAWGVALALLFVVVLGLAYWILPQWGENTLSTNPSPTAPSIAERKDDQANAETETATATTAPTPASATAIAIAAVRTPVTLITTTIDVPPTETLQPTVITNGVDTAPTSTLLPTSTPIPATDTPSPTPSVTYSPTPAPTLTSTPTQTASQPSDQNSPIDPTGLMGSVHLGQPEDNTTVSGPEVNFNWRVGNRNLPAIQVALSAASSLLFEPILIKDGKAYGLTAASHKQDSFKLSVEALKGPPWYLEEGKTYQWTIRLGRKIGDNFEQIQYLAKPNSFLFKPTSGGGGDGNNGNDVSGK